MDRDHMNAEWYDISDYHRLQFVGENVEQILSIVLENVQAGIGLFEAGEKVRALYLNKAFFECIGFSPENYMEKSRNIFSTLLPEYAKGFGACIRERAPKGLPISYMVCGSREDGSLGWFDIKGAPVKNVINEKPIYLCVITDVTDKKEKDSRFAELKQLNDKLMMHEQRYRILSATTHGILFEYTPEDDTMTFSYNLPHNHKTKKITEYRSYLQNNPLVHSDHIEKFTNALMTALEKDTEGELEYLSTVSGGGYRWHSTFYKSVLRQDGTVGSVVGRIRDIHEEKMKQEKMNYQAQIDGLTGLYRKEIVFDMMKEYIEESPKAEFFFLLLDLDNFKMINDQYGHQYGDKVLKEAADKLLSIFAEDCIVGRFGGDEFVIMSKNIGREEMEGRLEKLTQDIACSVGVVPWRYGMTVEEVFDWADANMYEAKKEGRQENNNRVCFEKVPFRQMQNIEE